MAGAAPPVVTLGNGATTASGSVAKSHIKLVRFGNLLTLPRFSVSIENDPLMNGYVDWSC